MRQIFSILSKIPLMCFNGGLLFFFLACTNLQFENNTRLLIRGIVIDESGDPIPNISVEVYAITNEERFLSTNTESVIVGFSLTETDGSFEITSLSPINDLITIVSINTIEARSRRQNPEYETLRIDLSDFAMDKGERFTFPSPIILKNQ